MIFCSCIKCKSEVTTSQIDKHFLSKTCLSGGKQKPSYYDGHLICVYCEKEFMTKRGIIPHELVCPENHGRKYKNGMLGKSHPNKGQTKETNEKIFYQSIRTKIKYANGILKPTGFAIWTKEQRSINAKIHNCGGYRKNAGRSKKYKVVDSFGKETTLQSSFEFRCMEILNELKINWIRPKSLKYDNRNYFADFYLPDFNIWLDPKNSYKAKQDEEKIRKVIEQNNVKLFILLEENLTKEYIGRLTEMD